MSGYIGNQVTPQATTASNLGPNLLINPNFNLDQINSGSLFTVTGGGGSTITVDGWSGFGAAAPGVFKVRRLADPDNASLFCMEITCTTADAAIAAADAYKIFTAVEGYDAASLMIGTSFAKSATLTFNFKSNVTGVYGVALQNSAADRCYVSIMTVADTSEHTYTFTVPMDTTGTWLYTTGVGLFLNITLAGGANFQTTAGSWQAGAFLTTSAQCNFMSVNTNVAYLKRIQLVVGSASLPFSPANIQTELSKCQRYLVQEGIPSFGGNQINGQGLSQGYAWPVTMRAAPTITVVTTPTLNSTTTFTATADTTRTWHSSFTATATGQGGYNADGVIRGNARLA